MNMEFCLHFTKVLLPNMEQVFKVGNGLRGFTKQIIRKCAIELNKNRQMSNPSLLVQKRISTLL